MSNEQFPPSSPVASWLPARKLAQLPLVPDPIAGEEAGLEPELDADGGLALAALADLEQEEINR